MTSTIKTFPSQPLPLDAPRLLDAEGTEHPIWRGAGTGGGMPIESMANSHIRNAMRKLSTSNHPQRELALSLFQRELAARAKLERPYRGEHARRR